MPMPREYHGEIYLTLAEAVECLGVSRRTFYRGAKKVLNQYNLGGLERAFYKRDEVEALKEPHLRETKRTP